MKYKFKNGFKYLGLGMACVFLGWGVSANARTDFAFGASVETVFEGHVYEVKSNTLLKNCIVKTNNYYPEIAGNPIPLKNNGGNSALKELGNTVFQPILVGYKAECDGKKINVNFIDMLSPQSKEYYNLVLDTNQINTYKSEYNKNYDNLPTSDRFNSIVVTMLDDIGINSI